MKDRNTGARLREIRKELGMKQEDLSSILGVGKSALSMIETGKAALSERNKQIIIQELNVNEEWLDSGRGEMFNCDKAMIMPSSNRKGMERIIPLQSVPLYDLAGTAGLVPLFLEQDNMKPLNYIHIPNLPKCDGAIYVVGDSMYPLLKSGDIVLYKQMNSLDDIFWGDMYLLSIDIDGDEYITVKYIQKSDRPGHIKLVSENKHHAEKEVETSRIRALAFIKASIRMNTMN